MPYIRNRSKRKPSKGPNWVTPFYQNMEHIEAIRLLEKVKKQRYGRNQKYKLVKVCDAPLTFKEVRIHASSKSKKPSY